jgi:hypothetical protein
MIRRLSWTAAVVVLAGTVACWPTTTRFGIDYQVSSKTIPLYEKAVNFVSRDLQTRRLAREVTAGVVDARSKALTVFRWVGSNVRRTPPGFPIVDDHLWHVIVRGYGAPDQRTEVYALLATYSGVPAASTALVKLVDGRTRGLMVAITEFEGRRWLFDVDNQLLFVRPDGALASLDDLVAQSAIVARVAGDLKVNGIPYLQYFEHLDRVSYSFQRIERQQPLPRLLQTLRHPFGAAN